MYIRPLSKYRKAQREWIIDGYLHYRRIWWTYFSPALALYLAKQSVYHDSKLVRGIYRPPAHPLP